MYVNPGGGGDEYRKVQKAKRTVRRVARTASRASTRAKINYAKPRIRRIARAATQSYNKVQPRRRYVAPKRTYRAPVRRYVAPKRAYRAPARRYVPPRPRPATGNTRGGAVRRARPAPIAPRPAPAPKPKPMSVDQWLARDTAYGQQKTAYEKALADYAAQMKGEQDKYTSEYKASTDKLGVDRKVGQEALTDDYAGRGMIQSGVYGDALKDYQTEWDTKASDLERAKNAYMSDLVLGQTNFKSEQGTYMTKAEQDAMNRRAMRYSL